MAGPIQPVGGVCGACKCLFPTCCTYTIWARIWTFSVAGIVNKAVCTKCAGYNGNWTVYSLAGFCLWTSNDLDGKCINGADSWTMFCQTQPLGGGTTCPDTLTVPFVGLGFNADNAGPLRDPNNNCVGIPNQQNPAWQLDFWALPVAQFNPTGVNVMPYICQDTRVCRDCDASAVGPITITPVFG